MSPDLHHLAAAYAVDALDEIERREFEQHYPDCDICSQEVLEFRDVAAALGASIAEPPPMDLKASVMKEVSATRQLPPLPGAAPASGRRTGNWVVAAAAAVLLVVGGVIGAVAFSDAPDDPVSELVSAPDVFFTTLEGSEGTIQIAYSDQRDEVAVIGANLPELDDDEAYALWFLLADGVAPAGLFRPDGGSVRETLTVDDVVMTGWGITIEPRTGSPQPTTDVIFVGLL